MTTDFQNSIFLSFSSRVHYKLHVCGYEGAVIDQAELLGMLSSIYEMHLPLLSDSIIEPF